MANDGSPETDFVIVPSRPNIAIATVRRDPQDYPYLHDRPFSSCPCELYLIERWHDYHDLEPDQRRRTIFNEYVKLGAAGRQYLLLLAEYTSLSEAEEQIVDSCRTKQEREISRSMMRAKDIRPVFKTSYGGIDPLPELVPEPTNNFDVMTGTWLCSEEDSMKLVCDDQKRYAGERVLDFLPEVVHSLHHPDYETENDAWEETWLWRFATGGYWEMDDETAETGNLKFFWLDEYGKSVKEIRFNDEEMFLQLARISGCGHRYTELYWWQNALPQGHYAALYKECAARKKAARRSLEEWYDENAAESSDSDEYET